MSALKVGAGKMEKLFTRDMVKGLTAKSKLTNVKSAYISCDWS